MKNKKCFLTSGEFAKMNGINKRTLHYYNDIGLFRPEMIDENGYHYYSRFQAVQLEMILIFRRLGLSIEEIWAYTDRPADASFTKIIKEKQELIDRSVHQLLEVKAFLQQKQEKLALGLSASHGKIERIHLPKRHILLSAPITGAYDEHDFSVAADFSLRLKTIFGLYDNFGSRISVENICSDNFNDYDCFFYYGTNDERPYDAVLPAGEYLRAFSVGSWDRLKDVYDRLLSYSQDQGLTLTGFAYEEGLNEMALRERGDYITMITVAYTQ